MESANGKTLESAGLVSERVKLRLAGSCGREPDDDPDGAIVQGLLDFKGKDLQAPIDEELCIHSASFGDKSRVGLM